MAKLNLKETNDLIKLINKELGNLESKKFNNLKDATAELETLRRELNKASSDVDYFSNSLKGSVEELQKSNFALGLAKKSFKSLTGIAEDYAQVLNGSVQLSDKEIKQKRNLAKIEFERLKYAEKYGDLSPKEREEISKRIQEEKAYFKALDDVEQFQKKINDQSGVRIFGGLNEIAEIIPGMKMLTGGFEEAAIAAKETATQNAINLEMAEKEAEIQREADIAALKSGKDLTMDAIDRLGLADKLVSKEGERIAGASAAAKANKLGLGEKDFADIPIVSPKKNSAMLSGIKALGKNLMKSLGPLALLKELVDAMVASDKAASDMAKNMGITYDEALALKQQMTDIAMASGETFVLSKGILETFNAMNEALGTRSMASDDVLVGFTKLREMAGFTNEELQGMQKLILGTSNSVDDVTGQFLAQARITATTNGVLLNEQKLLKDIGNVSAATTLSFGKNPALIGEAVSMAKSLGMELKQVEGIADSLLNFEDSIRNELEAELLINKDINLERARQAALNNDLATVAKEISEQFGSSEEFSELNRIQQEALAKSVGMTRDDLAETLLLQDQLKGLSEEDAKAAKAKFETLKAQFGIEEAQRILQEEGVEGLENQVGIADKFNAQMEKLKEIFVVVGEALLPIFDILVSLFDVIGPLMKALNPVIQILLMGVAAIQDVVNGLLFLLSFGSIDNFTGKGLAMTKQAGKIETSAQASYGYNFGVTEEGRAAKMAMGGIVTGPTRAIVGEAGPEAVVPLSDNSPMIKQANETNSLLKQLIKAQPKVDMVVLNQVQ